MNCKNKTCSAQRGFTLIEMAVVLVIIGVVLSAVSVGRDLRRDAEMQRIFSSFAGAWKQTYDQYFQRTGVVLGDNQVAPTFMVNGQEAQINNAGGAVAGLPENYTNTGLRICRGQGYASNSVGDGDPQLSSQNLHELMRRVGINMPNGRAVGQEDRFLYTDSNGNATELQICFQWNPPQTNSGAGNVMVIRGLTPDLARALDRMVDGVPDAIEGRFRQQDSSLNTGANTSQQPGREWGANNTFAQGGGQQTTADGEGDNQDENRVVLLTAHWLMDQ
ncbi:MAG TPA: prepilin-type cleavage/methylation domain-containing protein [Pseudohongiella sp.]|nr:prepilin-type cleavage/methylation domain-containing protein [Pseudohongiella sp.]HBX37176.1 prepilin-type cleavage/methylation domain-containing protein [Pseudohongiella sp.]|tara:strand:- start:18504 stop:19331 length:828 start_codon:yes stop_codon:yes gene_type:complete